MKYKTKPIDYSGCNEIIAEHLKRGEAVWCEFGHHGKKEWIIGYDSRAEDYLTADCNWSQKAKPIPTKLRFKKASQIIKWLEDEGWEYIRESNAFKKQPEGIWYIETIFALAGTVKQPFDAGQIEWLEEVE